MCLLNNKEALREQGSVLCAQLTIKQKRKLTLQIAKISFETHLVKKKVLASGHIVVNEKFIKEKYFIKNL